MFEFWVQREDMEEVRRVVRQLRGVAHKLTSDHELQKDLLQEMLLHLLRIQKLQPNMSLSWYIKSCEFHARNHLKLGRSIDSWKRSRNHVSFGVVRGQPGDEAEDHLDPAQSRHFVDEVVANDIEDQIRARLTETQRRVLLLLMEGFGVREVARRLGMSHPAVIKHRKKIATVARFYLDDQSPDLDGVGVNADGDLGHWAAV